MPCTPGPAARGRRARARSPKHSLRSRRFTGRRPAGGPRDPRHLLLPHAPGRERRRGRAVPALRHADAGRGSGPVDARGRRDRLGRERGLASRAVARPRPRRCASSLRKRDGLAARCPTDLPDRAHAEDHLFVIDRSLADPPPRDIPIPAEPRATTCSASRRRGRALPRVRGPAALESGARQVWFEITSPAAGLPVADRTDRDTAVVDGLTYRLTLEDRPVHAGRSMRARLRVTTADGKPFTALEPRWNLRAPASASARRAAPSCTAIRWAPSPRAPTPAAGPRDGLLRLCRRARVRSRLFAQGADRRRSPLRQLRDDRRSVVPPPVLPEGPPYWRGVVEAEPPSRPRPRPPSPQVPVPPVVVDRDGAALPRELRGGYSRSARTCVAPAA